MSCISDLSFEGTGLRICLPYGTFDITFFPRISNFKNELIKDHLCQICIVPLSILFLNQLQQDVNILIVVISCQLMCIGCNDSYLSPDKEPSNTAIIIHTATEPPNTSKYTFIIQIIPYYY